MIDSSEKFSCKVLNFSFCVLLKGTVKVAQNSFQYFSSEVGEALEPRLAHIPVPAHEVARSISTSPGRDASPSQVTSPQFVIWVSQQFTSTHFIHLGGEAL